jgi:hypothetical protein
VGSTVTQPFTITEGGGTWHNAQQVPGIKAVDSGRAAGVSNLSCPPVGACVSAGTYLTSYSIQDYQQIFVVG